MKRGETLRWAQLKVGIMLVVAFLILLWVAFNSEAPAFLRSEQPLVARFASAEGLASGAPVYFLGIEAGTVQAVELDPGGPGPGAAPERASAERPGEEDALGAQATDAAPAREAGPAGGTAAPVAQELPIRVTFTVADQIEEQLRADASVRISSLGVLGDKYLELLPGEDPRPLPEDEVLRGRPTAGFTDLIQPGREALTRVDELLVDLEAISTGIRRGEGTVGRLLAEDALHGELVGTLQETRQTLVALRATQDQVGARLASATGSLARAAGSIDSLASGWRRGEGTIERLAEDPSLYENLNGAAARLERVLARVEGGQGLLARSLEDPYLGDQFTGLVVDLRALLKDMRENPGRYVSFSVF